MPKIVVEVMPKPALLDPAGKAVAGALDRLGKGKFHSARVGKRFEMVVDGPITEEIKAEAAQVASVVFANSAIEDVVSITFEEAE